MCQAHPARRHLVAKDSAAAQAARQTFVETFVAILRAWHSDILAALEAGDLPLAADRALRAALETTLSAYRGDVLSTYETLHREAGAAGRAGAARRYDLDVDPDLPDRVAVELEQVAARGATHIGDRMRDDIAEVLRDAHDEGLAIPEIERILRQSVFADMAPYEAERAARTEGTTAANRGAVSSYEDAGAVGKTWQAEDDSRTRPTHREADGQTVPINQAFKVDGHAAQFPGDPSLPIDERVWCRCSCGPAWDL